MLHKNVLDLSKVWFRFSKTASNGKILKLRWEPVTEQRFEEFVDFKMNFFVKHEISHVVAGIYKSPEAMKEYREIVAKKYKDPSYCNAICCTDDKTENIVAFDSMKLYRRGEIYEDFMHAQTAEVKRFFHICHNWNNLCPVPDILAKYGVNKYFDDAGTAVHPDYRGYRITKELVLLRSKVCKSNAVLLTGAWMNSVAIQKTTEKDGWETIYEVGYEELEKILNIKFQNAPRVFQYKIKMID